MNDRYVALEKRVQSDHTSKKETKTNDKYEQFAVNAVKAEITGDFAKAAHEWEDLKTSAEASSERRSWYLLAAKRSRELRENKTPK